VTVYRPTISRRHFLAVTALGAFGAQRATASIVAGHSSSSGSPETLGKGTYDLIIIGGGTAGIPCAIFAAEAGAKVIMIEKSGQLGGSLWLAGGSMAASGTRLQARLGIKDSAQNHYEDIMNLGHGKADPAVVRRYVENSGAMADWLEDIGFQVREGEPVAGRGGHAAFSIPRYFQGPEKGRSLLKVMLPELKKHVDAGSVRLAMSTDVLELIINRDQSIGGVIAQAKRGKRTQIMARKVVISSGGYCHSPEMFTRVTGFACYAPTSYYMSKGEGLLLGEAAGGYVHGGEFQVLGPGGILNERTYPSSFVYQPELDFHRRPQWEIRVNQSGERFVREDHPDQDLRDLLFTRQPTQRMWLIYDQSIANKAPSILRGKDKAYVESLFGSHPMFMRAPTLSALAAMAKINAENLERTVQQYNAGVREKRDSLGREFLPAEIAEGPFSAIEVTGGNLIGFGGLKVDPDMRLLRRDGSPIRNLYAAGEVIGLHTIMGDSVVSGSGVTPSLTFGRLLGKSIMTAA
jgi:fumarate reductase flavoprotein subunit